jgi:hypothetical protein
MLLGPLFGAALVGAIYSAIAARAAKKRSIKVATGQKLAAVEDGMLVTPVRGKDATPDLSPQ